jgi:hypothetical protein
MIPKVSRLLWVIAGLAACGKGSGSGAHSSDPNVSVTAQLEGPQVVIEVTCKGKYQVWYPKMDGPEGTPCETGKPARFTRPVTELGSAGEHELEIAVRNHDTGEHHMEQSSAVAKIAIPADVLAAQLVIAGCGGGSGSNVHLSVAGAASPTVCGLEPTFSTKLKLTAPAGVDVAIGKHGYIAPPSGPLEVEVDLADPLLDRSISDLHDASTKLEIPWHVGAGAGRLSADVDRPGAAMSKWFGAVAAGTVARPKFDAKGGTLFTILGTGVDSTEPKRPLREHKLLAVATRSEQKDLGTCKFANDDFAKTGRSHLGFDATVDVYDTTTWQKVATQVFPTTKACPDKVTVMVQKRPGDESLAGDPVSGAVYSEPDWPAIVRWLSGDITKPPEPPATPAKTPTKTPAKKPPPKKKKR